MSSIVSSSTWCSKTTTNQLHSGSSNLTGRNKKKFLVKQHPHKLRLKALLIKKDKNALKKSKFRVFASSTDTYKITLKMPDDTEKIIECSADSYILDAADV